MSTEDIVELTTEDVRCVMASIRYCNGVVGASSDRHVAAVERQLRIAKQVEKLLQCLQHHKLYGELEYDLSMISSLHIPLQPTVESHVYRAKFYACLDEFVKLHPVKADCDNKCYAIWVEEGGEVHRVDIVRRGDQWYDIAGNPLRKWGGHVIADHGIMIAKDRFYQMRECGERYRIMSCVAYLQASAATHSDKKRRADDTA